MLNSKGCGTCEEDDLIAGFGRHDDTYGVQAGSFDPSKDFGMHEVKTQGRGRSFNRRRKLEKDAVILDAVRPLLLSVKSEVHSSESRSVYWEMVGGAEGDWREGRDGVGGLVLAAMFMEVMEHMFGGDDESTEESGADTDEDEDEDKEGTGFWDPDGSCPPFTLC